MAKPLPSFRSILGTKGDDIPLAGNGSASAINGDNGNDVLTGWGVSYDTGTHLATEDPGMAWDESLNGGRGADALYAGAGNDTLNGGAGNDYLAGGSGSDVFMLSAGDDTIADFTSGTPTDVLLTFEGLIDPYTGSIVHLETYMGLYLWNFGALDVPATEYQGTGWETALASGTTVGFDEYGANCSITDYATDFDFVRGYFAAGWDAMQVVEVYAYDDGSLVGTATFANSGSTRQLVDFAAGTATNQGDYTAVFSGRFTSIDSVLFQSGGQHIAMDDLLLQYGGGGGGDLIDVPDGTDVAALIAGAESDGSGGTVLTHATGTLTLVGVDPAVLNAGWFV